MNISVTPIVPVRERNREEGLATARKSIDTKVLGFVLQRISHAKERAASFCHGPSNRHRSIACL